MNIHINLNVARTAVGTCLVDTLEKTDNVQVPAVSIRSRIRSRLSWTLDSVDWRRQYMNEVL